MSCHLKLKSLLEEHCYKSYVSMVLGSYSIVPRVFVWRKTVRGRITAERPGRHWCRRFARVARNSPGKEKVGSSFVYRGGGIPRGPPLMLRGSYALLLMSLLLVYVACVLLLRRLVDTVIFNTWSS